MTEHSAVMSRVKIGRVTCLSATKFSANHSRCWHWTVHLNPALELYKLNVIPMILHRLSLCGKLKWTQCGDIFGKYRLLNILLHMTVFRDTCLILNLMVKDNTLWGELIGILEDKWDNSSKWVMAHYIVGWLFSGIQFKGIHPRESLCS